MRIKALLTVAVCLLLFQAIRYVYRWYAYAGERTTLEAMHERASDAGAAVVVTELRADSLHGQVTRLDRELETGRRTLAAYGKHADAGSLAPHLYDAYTADIDAYNRQVRERNTTYQAYRAVVSQNHAAVARYNAVTDSMRRIAEEIRDPYYPVPLPAEAASARGIRPRTSAPASRE